MTLKSATIVLVSVAVAGGCAQAQCDIACTHAFDPALGVPDTQCFSRLVTGATVSATVTGGVLHVSSTSPIEGAPNGLLFRSARVPPTYLWTDGAVIDVTARVNAGIGRYWHNSTAFRSGLSFGGADASRRIIRMWMWADPSPGVALSSDNNATQGPMLSLASVPGGAEYRWYRLITDVNGARMYVNGEHVLTVPVGNFGQDDPSSSMWLASSYAGPVVDADITQWRMIFGLAPSIDGASHRAVCQHGSIPLELAVAGTGPFSYAWHHDGTPVAGPQGSAATLVITDADAADAGIYTCVVTNSCGTVETTPVTLVVQSADFNHDGDTGTDSDIESFFACLAGSCCPTCGTADFNGDGDFGTDADIESFFRVLAGGPC